MSGEKPVTVSGPDWEGDWGREEGEGEQERVYFVRYPRCWATGRGNQENVTSLSPTTVWNISGAPDGSVCTQQCDS